MFPKVPQTHLLSGPLIFHYATRVLLGTTEHLRVFNDVKS